MHPYWNLPAKPAPEPAPTFMDVEKIGLTFPMTGLSIRPREDSGDKRIVRSKSGKMIGYRALENISLSLKEGDRLGIIGKNGSGKTTLLQVLAGILTPDSGQITRRGNIMSLININLGVQPEATGHINITLKGLAAGFTRRQIEARREAIAEFSELGDFLDMPVVTYSAGMRMRLVFSIATAFEPEILILDEWLSAGDIAFKNKATERMQGFVEKAGILIMASHNRKLTLENSDRILWLEDGRVRALGPSEEVWAEYEAAQSPQPKIRIVSGGN